MKIQTFRKPHQWLNFWLERYSEFLSELKYSAEEKKEFWNVLKLFLTAHTGNPRNIPCESVISFVKINIKERLIPLALFYKNIAPSTSHFEILKTLGDIESIVGEKSFKNDIEKFEKILVEQSFNERTIKNYCSVVEAFLNWLECAKNDGSCVEENIEKYCNYLIEKKHLSPKTTAMHASAIRLFYKTLSSQENKNK
ncbi:MAG: phage integrase N-terminal SAM-like domain-containing protein [Chitinispirillaceae bacterium]|nr:phage integrase N-terminal SAM-like domain-containing protein [Chitinispirillaceae bacterium]